MRLWHKDLIKYLPSSQLVAQWRELNSIYKKQDNHLLINYIYGYGKEVLRSYSDLVVKKIKQRNYNIREWGKYEAYFKGTDSIDINFDEHDDLYFEICFYNLCEKKLRGQKDYSDEDWNKLVAYRRERFGDNFDFYSLIEGMTSDGKRS